MCHLRVGCLGRIYSLAAIGLLLTGCLSRKPSNEQAAAPNAKPPPSAVKTDDPEEAKGPKVRKVSELRAKVGDYLPPLDDGRIEIARPEGWEVGSRQRDHLIWFHRYKDVQTLPQIRITAISAPAEAPQNVTPADVEQFAEWLAGHVKQQLNSGETLIEPVKPMIIGDIAVGRYVRKGSYRSADVEQHLLVTIHNGRMYTLQQLLLKGDLQTKPDFRDAAYAVVAGLKFSAGDSSPAPDADPAAPTETATP